MEKYILQKKLPDCNVGMIFRKCISEYYQNFYTDEYHKFLIHKDIVENNPEWFKEIKLND
jgi:hypothetical protein